MDNIKTWTELSVEESTRMTARERDRNGESRQPTLGSKTAKEQNITAY